jgi:hypothetical protein
VGNAAHALGFDGSDGKTSEARDVFRAIAGAYAAAVFIEIPVQDIMAAILNAPVAAIDGKEFFCISLLWGSAGNSVERLIADKSPLVGLKIDLQPVGYFLDEIVYIKGKTRARAAVSSTLIRAPVVRASWNWFSTRTMKGAR